MRSMAMRALIWELRALQELSAGDDAGGDESPDQVKARTGRCPPGYHQDEKGKCIASDDTAPAPEKPAADQPKSTGTKKPDVEPEEPEETPEQAKKANLEKWADDAGLPPETKKLISDDNARAQAVETAAQEVNAQAAKATEVVTPEEEEKAQDAFAKLEAEKELKNKLKEYGDVSRETETDSNGNPLGVFRVKRDDDPRSDVCFNMKGQEIQCSPRPEPGEPGEKGGKGKGEEEESEEEGFLGSLLTNMAKALAVSALATAGFTLLGPHLAGALAVGAGYTALDWLFGGEEAEGSPTLTKERMAHVVAKALTTQLRTKGISLDDMAQAAQAAQTSPKPTRESKMRRMRELVRG
jgi:hypothetical protein